MVKWVQRAIERFRAMLGRRHHVRAHFWQTVANYAQQGGSLILGVCLARLLVPEDFGVVAVLGAFLGMVFLPLEWSAAQVLVSDRGRTPGLFSEVMSFGLVIMALKSLVAAVLVLGFFHLRGGFEAGLLTVLALPMISGTAAGIWRSAAEGGGHFKANFHVQALTMGLAFGVGIGGAWAGWGPWALAGMGLMTALPPLFVYPRFCPESFRWKFNRQIIRARGMEGFWMWLNGASESSLSRVDRLFLGRVVGEADVGNYSRAFGYANLSSWVLNSFMTNPAVVALAQAEDPRQVRRILRNHALILFSGALVSFAVFYHFSDPLVPWVFGEQWREAIPAFRAFAPINLCAAFLYLPITLLLARKDLAAVALARLAGLLLFSAGAAWMGASLTVEATAWFFQAALLLPGLVCWVRAWRYLYPMKENGE